MKKFTSLLIISFLIFMVSHKLEAQERRFGISTGYEMDMLNSLNPAFIANSSDISMSNFNNIEQIGAYSSSGCENIHFRIFSSFPVTKFKNTSVYAAFIGIFNRSDRISYLTSSNYIGIGALSNELALEFSLDKRFKLFDIAYLDLGLGNNAGLGYGGSSYIADYSWDSESELQYRSLTDVATASDIAAVNSISPREVGNNFSSVNTRIFGKAGVGIILLKKIELGLTFRYGYGARVFSNNFVATTQYNSVELGSAFRF